MRKFLFVLLIFIIPAMILGCGQKQTNDVKTIRVGMNMNYQPFEFIDEYNRAVKGFDVDIMEAIGKELGVNVEFQDIDYDNLLDVLEKGNIDAIISAMTITEEKKARANFTKPYFKTGIAAATLENNKTVKGFADLPGKRVAVVKGTPADVELREQKSVTAVELPSEDDIFHSLQSGNIDAVVSDNASLYYYLNNHDSLKLKILPGLYKEEHYGIAINKKNKELLNQIDDALQKIKDKGVYDKIHAKWFGEKLNKN